LTIASSKRGNQYRKGIGQHVAKKCRGYECCDKFAPRGDKYNLEGCIELMCAVIRPWVPNSGHFIYDYLGITKRDVVDGRLRR
jgi:hypothetical protein